MFVSGYFEANPADSISRGYGVFGLDILGIFDPKIEGNILNWSLFLKEINGTTTEGFNYYGLGSLVLLTSFFLTYLFKIKTKRKNLLDSIRNNLGFFLIVIILSLWAITTNIHFAGEEIFSLNLNKFFFGILGIFATTGRFFWPVYYLLLILSLVYIYENFKTKNIFPFVFIVLLIQIIDISPGLNNYFVKKNHIAEIQTFQDKIWNTIANDYEKIRTTYLTNNYGNTFVRLNHFLGTAKIKKTDIILNASASFSPAT